MAIWMWTFLNFWIFVVKRIATRFNTFDNRSLMHQSILAELSPPPAGLLRGICPPCQSRGEALANVALPGGRAFVSPGAIPELLTRTLFPIITTQRILLGKKAGWLICLGQEKTEEGCKGMFLIFCLHFFVAYQARIT